jgi:hypothetical protein
MPSDMLNVFQIPVTKNASYTSMPITSEGLAADRQAVCVVDYSAASVSSGSGTAVFSVQASDDNGNTWATAGTGATVNLTTTAVQGERSFLFYHPLLSYPSSSVPVQYRLSLVLTGTNPVVTYSSVYAASDAMLGV